MVIRNMEDLYNILDEIIQASPKDKREDLEKWKQLVKKDPYVKYKLREYENKNELDKIVEMFKAMKKYIKKNNITM